MAAARLPRQAHARAQPRSAPALAPAHSPAQGSLPPPLPRWQVVEEIRLLASLRHPALVTYYEAFCDHDKLCVVTELVQGGDLGSFLGCGAGAGRRCRALQRRRGGQRHWASLLHPPKSPPPKHLPQLGVCK